LAPESSGLLSDGSFFDIYEFSGAPRQFATVRVSSQTFDAVVAVMGPGGRLIANNDDVDPKAGHDAGVSLYIPAAGTYQVWVNTYSPGGGEYEVEMKMADRSEKPTELHPGETVHGWLTPGDARNEDGSYIDRWTLRMEERPLVIWLRSDELDTLLTARRQDGRLLIANDDLDQIGGDHDSRIVLSPSPQAPVGSQVVLEAASSGKGAAEGAYRLTALPLPEISRKLSGQVTIRLVIVRGEEGRGGAEVSPREVEAAVRRAREVWSACGIDVVEDGPVRTIDLPGLEGRVKVMTETWTPQELLLQGHPLHARPEEGIFTVYIVHETDGGERHGLAYPVTRYSSGRSGVLLADGAFQGSPVPLTLAHEIGHMLGLGHAEGVDGDPWNDTSANLMSTREGSVSPQGALDPLQCLIARAAPHYLATRGSAPLVSAAFAREDKVLRDGVTVSGSLAAGDAAIEGGRLLDVYYFYGTAGERVRIDALSDSIDAFLLLDGPDGERLAQDDDGGGGRNAALSLTLPATGDYSVGITSALPQTGPYSLQLQHLPMLPAPAAAPPSRSRATARCRCSARRPASAD
jgi:hypothetical protein